MNPRLIVPWLLLTAWLPFVAAEERSLSEEEKIGHVLNRVAYGPSAADVARVRAMGVRAYLDEQLHPERLDGVEPEILREAEASLFLDMIPGSRAFLVREGDTWQYFKGKVEPPRGWQALSFVARGWPTGRSGFGYGDDDDRTVIDDMRGTDEQEGFLSLYVRREFHVANLDSIGHLYLRVGYDDGFVAYLNGREILRKNLEGSPPRHDQKASVSSGTVERGEHDVFPIPEAKRFLRKGKNVLAFQVHNHRIGSSDLTLIPELAYASEAPARIVAGVQQVQEWMHLRGVYSRKQLQAVMAEFWENHFCTDFDKVEDYIDDMPAYERKQSAEGEERVERQIRSEAAGIEMQEYTFLYKHALGHFGDLLLYSATSPSMLIYLDSVLNLKEEPNENYAREILELYAFGVDNRYTQKDIEELARCFTGWTIRKMDPKDKPSFPQSARSPSITPSQSIAQERVLLDDGAEWRYFKGRVEPTPDRKGAPTTRWAQTRYSDGSWLTGATGIGYDDGDDTTVLKDMQGRYVSVYLRKEVPITFPRGYEDVLLEFTYDDGYVVYVNGQEVGRSANMEDAGSPPAHDYIVPENHEIDEGVDTIDLKALRAFLKPPPALNTIAIQAHNGSRNSSDFSIRPRIVARNYEAGSIPLTDPLGTWTFRFRPDAHDTGEKILFEGTPHEIRVPAGREGRAGVQDAIQVIDAMAAHPSTSEFIVVKLLNKFVSDEISLETFHNRTAPPALLALMDEAIAAWNATERPGNLRHVMRTILDPDRQASAFWSRRAYGAKIKTPIEFINSAYRALGARLVGAAPTARMEEMGMDLFRRDDPDGYPELGYEWMDTHNLLERLRFCQSLAVNGEAAAGEWSLEDLMESDQLETPEAIIGYFNRLLFQGKLPARRQAVFLDFVHTDDEGYRDPVESLPKRARLHRLRQMVGMILSTQEFQFQ